MSTDKQTSNAGPEGRSERLGPTLIIALLVLALILVTVFFIGQLEPSGAGPR